MKTWIAIILALVAAVVPGWSQALDAMHRTTTAVGTDLIGIQTNSAGAAGQRFYRAMELDDFLAALVALDGWPAGNGSGFPSYGLTNNQSSAVRFASNVKVDGAFTNAGAFYASLLASNATPHLGAAGALTNRSKHYFINTNLAPILSNIVAATSSGDVVELGAGTFNIGFQSINIPVGVKLIGQGDGTIISGNSALYTNGPLVRVNSSNEVSGFCLNLASAGSWIQAGLGFNENVGNSAATNFTIRNVEVLNGQSDGFFFTHSNYFSGKIYDCRIASKWDALVLETSITNGVFDVEVWNTRIVSDMSGATLPSAISTATAKPVRINGGTTWFHNNTVIATNANTSYAISLSGAGPSHLHLVGGDYRAAGTNEAFIAEGIVSVFQASDHTLHIHGASGVTANSIKVGSNYRVYPFEVSTFFAHNASISTNLSVGGELNVFGASAVQAIEINGTANFPNLTPGQYLGLDGSGNVTTLAAGSGEANVNGEVSVTNATRFGLVYGKAGVTNLLRSIAARNGLVGTNESGTNISLEIDPAIVPTQTQLVAASNALVSILVANDTTTSNGLYSVETTRNAAVSNALASYIDTASSNRVRVAAGTGGITVTPSGSGGVMTFTVSDDDAGGGSTTNFLNLNSAFFIATNWVRAGQVDVATNLNAGSLTVTNGSLLSGTNVIPTGSSLTVHVTTNTGVVVQQHSVFLNGRKIHNIDKVGTSVSVGNSAGPSFSIATNQAITFTHSGSAIHGQAISLMVSNTATTNFAVGFPSAWSPQLGSNVTSWLVAASNYVILPFRYTTNEVGGGIWILDRPTEFELGLAVASAGGNGFLALLTNSASVVLSNSYLPQASSINLSNWSGFSTNVWNDRQGGSAALTNVANGIVLAVGQVDVRTNLNASNLTVTNGVSYIAAATAGVGTSSTNVTVVVSGSRRQYLNGGLTNLAIVAIMGGSSTLHSPIVIIATNRTATVCTMTLSSATNNWINVGSLSAPFSITNGLWVSTETLGTNVYYAARYMANPTQ